LKQAKEEESDKSETQKEIVAKKEKEDKASRRGIPNFFDDSVPLGN